MARALRFQAHVPLKFCGECVLTAAFLINRLPSSVLLGKYPYEGFHGHPPTFDFIRVFGCLCYVTALHNTDKLSQKAIPSIFMGYSTSQKGYRLYNIFTGTFFVSRDVSFRETVFPFKHPKSTFLHTLSSRSSPTFPVSTPPFPFDDSFPASIDSLPPTTLDSPVPPTTSEHSLPPYSSIPIFSPLHSSPIPSPTSSSPILSDPPTLLPSIHQHQDLPHTPAAPLRKSGRPSKLPLWLTDFVHQVKPSYSTPYSITDSINYSSLSPSYQTCLSSY
ncbi:uncharacterized protein LOC142182194 [Nicotiana tabacum]|uniref:Uncharacterized protein LOC142182194 n=1 Tax=Nicotiana tabacum TaxID=4097 RepID=A0AC58US57_TOBAC